MGRPAVVIEVEYHTLALAQHAKYGTLEGYGGEVELGEIDVGHQHTVFGGWVI